MVKLSCLSCVFKKKVELSPDFVYIIIDEKKELLRMNLDIVFWDLPKFTDENYLLEFLKEQKGKVPYYWAMTRFLKFGRVVDTLKLFNIKEVIENLDKLQLPEYALKKWKRMGEVFG
jgi:DNA-directed RNA polymerase subunit H (RpoH/RPB5)